MDQSLSLREPIHSAILRRSFRDAFRKPRSISEHSTLLPDRVGHFKTPLALVRGILCHSVKHYVTPRTTLSLRGILLHSANLNTICGTAKMLPRSPNTVYRTIRTLHNHPKGCLETPCHSAEHFPTPRDISSTPRDVCYSAKHIQVSRNCSDCSGHSGTKLNPSEPM